MNHSKYFFLVVAGLLIAGCNSSSTSNEETKNAQEVSEFNFSDFRIKKGQLGEITIGMTMQEAESKFKGLTKKGGNAWDYGLDGGKEGDCSAYYKQDELVFVLIPKAETDTLGFIIAVHKELQTSNGLTPASTIEELTKKYPKLQISYSLMSEWEYFFDDQNHWQFNFITDENTRIGRYDSTGLEMPSKPFRMQTKAAWIMIE